jgi:hypothetical protein
MISSKISTGGILEGRVALLSRKVEDLFTVLEGLLNSKLPSRFPACSSVAFDLESSKEQRFRIGYLDGDCSNSMKRSILTSYGHLASSGHELVKLPQALPFIDEIFKVTIQLYLNVNFMSQDLLLSKPEE